MRAYLLFSTLSLSAALAPLGCSDIDACSEGLCTDSSSSNGASGSGGDAGAASGGGGSGANAGSGGSGGSGGVEPCNGACSEPTPLCNEATNECVACLDHADCTDPAAAKCEAGACVPCTESKQCEGHAGTEVCNEGTCVECALDAAKACGDGTTCNLLEHACVDVPAGSISNCEACSNDSQCADGHHCIPMDFDGSPHGYYCLEEAAPTCEQPFSIFISKPSISGAPATNHCGINEDLATCEAVLALVNNWRCSATDGTGDGKCSPDGVQPEVAVPGAICKQVGGLDKRCTYACDLTLECLDSGPPSTCGEDGGHSPPGWCGG